MSDIFPFNYEAGAVDQKNEAVINLAKKVGSAVTVIAIAGMDNSLGRFVRNQLDIARRFEEEKLLKEKLEIEVEELK